MLLRSNGSVKVLKKLLRPLQKGHHIFGDYTGTVDVRKDFFPPVLKSLKLDYGAMKWYGQFSL